MKFFKSRLFRLLLAIFYLILAYNLTRSIVVLWYKKDIIVDSQEALTQAQAENARLKAKLEEVNSPDFIDKEARNRLGMIKEGEKLVLLPSSQINQLSEETSLSDQPEDKKADNLPNWKKWWKLFF